MAEYTIEAVNPKTRSYETKFGNMISYQVKFQGKAEPVEISKKESSPAPVVGEVLEGDINTTQYGLKFKKSYNPSGGGNFGGSGSTKSSYVPKDDKAIQAQWALGRAVEAYGPIGDTELEEYLGKVTDLGVRLFDAIDFVKSSKDKEEATDTVSNDVPETDEGVAKLFDDVEVVEEAELPWTNS